MTEDRHAVLQALIAFTGSIDEIRGLLGSLDPDFDGAPLTMNSENIRKTLERYLKGDLSLNDVEDWANLIEGREDIAFNQADEELLDEVIYELANPELTEQLSNKRAEEIVSLLTNETE